MFQELRRVNYDSSYAYLSVSNGEEEQKFCVNYEQWRTRPIAVDSANAEVLRLGWWGGKINNTNVCNRNLSLQYTEQVVALNYRLSLEDGPCALPFVTTNTSFKGAIQYEVNSLTSQNASAAILLVERGRRYISRWGDYLFSEFYDPDLNQSTQLPTFFMYKSVFFNELLKLSQNSAGSDLLLRFYRPPSSLWDISMAIVWMIAMFCVAVGGYWAGLRKL
ncbi:unnamed protein product [Gongylonema pulchrum]|uniref:Transmembrane protein n=1 Tax=Gongylonema pulchrum TaxID=637853 RepID=A0A183CZM9_9BILA|nr:unnamed protein product [Gongylonema pulchrum]